VACQVRLLLRFWVARRACVPANMTKFIEIKSPVALAVFGAFLTPEPLGVCFVLAAAIWWAWRKIGRACCSTLLSIWERATGRSFAIFHRVISGLNRPGDDRLISREALPRRIRAVLVIDAESEPLVVTKTCPFGPKPTFKTAEDITFR
jgi:hypothetical protein